MIRKQRKAQWLYACPTCDHTSAITTDLFGAQENQLRHERSIDHAFKMIGQAFQPFVDAFNALIKPASDLEKQLAALYVPPQNIPHDPTLRGDRRKWGGR